MIGLKNISANNGWAMALAGALIVMGGLAVLSFAISQIHKILLLWENRNTYFKKNKKSGASPGTEDVDEPGVPGCFPSDIHETVSYFAPLIKKLGEPFQLVELHKLLREKAFPHPHLTLKQLQQEKILVPQGGGLFTWNPQKEK